MKQKNVITTAFLICEAVLYYFILTAGGEILRLCSYGAIGLCVLYCLLQGKNGQSLLQIGLLLTAAADFCLVICQPIQRLWGMVFFLGTQSCYALFLHGRMRHRLFWVIRLSVTVLALTVTSLVLGDDCDALALVSLAYYANLIFNLIMAAVNWRKHLMFAVALILFLLCDTVIGLQVAGDLYLPIREGSGLYQLLYSGFNLSWLFYLPSQVMIALLAGRKKPAE